MRGLLLALAACGRLGFDAQRTGGEVEDASLDASDDGQLPLRWTRIIAGDQTTCGIRDGRAFCWGRGTNGEIGDGGASDRPIPTAVTLPAGTVSALAQGEGHGCAIVDAIAYCWGDAPPGNGAAMSATPVAVASLPSPVTSISCGSGFSCAVAAGDVYCWGSDSGGALGNGPTSTTQMFPVMVALPDAAVGIDAGNDHVFALVATGAVYGWGHNDGPGALCTGATTTTYDAPALALVSGVLPSLAGWHACAIVGGGAQCWGLGTTGELGDGLSTSSTTPRNVSGLGAGVQTLAAGGGPTDLDATCAVVGGTVSCWGSGTFGRLGNGSTADEAVPRAASGVPANVVELALGYDHACARGADDTIHCWGRGDLGQLGDGASANSFAPVLVAAPN